jgi:glycosyltransferase involved in cell wall biosynthesis
VQANAFMSRVLFVLSPSYLPSGQLGGSVLIVNSLMKSFLARDWTVGFVGLVKPEKWREGAQHFDDRIRSWLALRTETVADDEVVGTAIREIDPDVIYCFGAEPARMARRACPRGCVIATFPGAASFSKRIDELYHGDFWTRVNAIRRIPVTLRKIRDERLKVMPGYAGADLIISHTYDVGLRYARRMGRTFSYRALPLEVVDAVERIGRHSPPTFLITGAATSTESRAGLRFLAAEIVPKLTAALSAGEIRIRIVGGGELPPRLAQALTRPGLEMLGYVATERLLEEYARCVALLVPSPLGKQSPTRVLDAFRRGIPVIAHRANQRAFFELAHGQNCLLASDGAGFAVAMREAIANPEVMASLAKRARWEFEKLYCAEQFCEFIIRSVATLSNENRDNHYLNQSA